MDRPCHSQYPVTMIALAVALSVQLSQVDLPPPPPPPQQAPLLLQQRPTGIERELTIRALREELEELRDQKASIGYFWPVTFSLVGAGVLLVGAGAVSSAGNAVSSSSASGIRTTGTALAIAGAAVSGLSVFWFVSRIGRSISLGSQIDDKEEQLRLYEAQRLQLSVLAVPGLGTFVGLQGRL
jgi:hypothetical protein